MRPKPHAAPGQRFNALKHGGYAESTLLPGEDAAQFQCDRRALFHTYRPQTRDEAHLVDAMMEYRWRLMRWRPVEAQFDRQAIAPDTDAADRVSEPTAHQRLHSSIDVTLHRARIERLWYRALSRLMLLQDQRRKGLVPGARKLPPGCYMETGGRVYGPIPAQETVPLPEPELGTATADRDPPTDSKAVRPSADGENGKSGEQQETRSGAVRSPGHTAAVNAGTGPVAHGVGVVQGSWRSQGRGGSRSTPMGDDGPRGL